MLSPATDGQAVRSIAIIGGGPGGNASLQADIAQIEPWQNAMSNYYRAASGLNVTQYPHGMKTYAAMMAAPDFTDCRQSA